MHPVRGILLLVQSYSRTAAAWAFRCSLGRAARYRVRVGDSVRTVVVCQASTTTRTVVQQLVLGAVRSVVDVRSPWRHNPRTGTAVACMGIPTSPWVRCWYAPMQAAAPPPRRRCAAAAGRRLQPRPQPQSPLWPPQHHCCSTVCPHDGRYRLSFWGCPPCIAASDAQEESAQAPIDASAASAAPEEGVQAQACVVSPPWLSYQRSAAGKKDWRGSIPHVYRDRQR